MIDNVGGRLSKRRFGVVSEGHDAGIGDLLGKEVFQPELLRLGVCPGREGIAAETVDGHDAVVNLQLAKLAGQWQTADEGYRETTYSTAGDAVASFGGYTMDSAMQRERLRHSGGRRALRSIRLSSTPPIACQEMEDW